MLSVQSVPGESRNHMCRTTYCAYPFAAREGRPKKQEMARGCVELRIGEGKRGILQAASLSRLNQQYLALR
jgi:hypothetical protein